MPVTVYIPTPFRKMTGNQSYVQAEGATVGEVLDHLGQEYPSLKHMIYDAQEEIPGHINIYINNTEIHTLQGKLTPVTEGDEMAVIPAIAGGAIGALTPEQVDRYSRHIIMPQVGPVGQRKLMEAKVLLIGAGGLGGPVSASSTSTLSTSPTSSGRCSTKPTTSASRRSSQPKRRCSPTTRRSTSSSTKRPSPPITQPSSSRNTTSS
jgi:molybdopterin converting factor small subunit